MRLAVAVDLSDTSADDVVARASRWVRQVDGTLDVVHVEGARYALEWVRDPAVRSVMDAEAKTLRESDERRLAELLQTIPGPQRGVSRLLSGEPAEALCEASGDYDALLVATHGRKGVAHFWLGSVAERVVRGASCTVIVLRLRAG